MFARAQRRAVLIAAVLALSACATSPRTFDAAQRDAVKSTDVVLMIPQPQLRAQIAESNGAAAMGTGVLGVLVDGGINSMRTNAANEALQPVLVKMAGYDFDAQFKPELERALAGVRWLAPTGMTLVKNVDSGTIVNRIRATPAGAVLFVAVDYALLPEFRGMRVSAQIAVMPPAPNMKLSEASRVEPLYRNTIIVEAFHESKPRWIGEATAMWTRDELLKRSLTYSATELARLIAADLDTLDGALTDGSATKVVRMPDRTVKATLNLALLPAPAAPAAAAVEPVAPVAEPAAPASGENETTPASN